MEASPDACSRLLTRAVSERDDVTKIGLAMFPTDYSIKPSELAQAVALRVGSLNWPMKSRLLDAAPEETRVAPYG
jgi:hypothetical protein